MLIDMIILAISTYSTTITTYYHLMVEITFLLV